MKRLAFLSDIHFGECQDLRAYGFAVKILEEIQPDSIVLAGDIFDHGAVGKYRKNPEKTVCLQDEINTGIKQLEKLVDACPTTYISMFTGNHESRLPHYLLDISKALYGLECFNPRKLYGLDDLGIEYIEKLREFVGADCSIFSVTKHIKGLEKKFGYKTVRTVMMKCAVDETET